MQHPIGFYSSHELRGMEKMQWGKAGRRTGLNSEIVADCNE